MLLAVAVGAASCVDENYDLSKLNTEITVGGDSLTVPVGETAKLTMKDLLGETSLDFLQKDADGSYKITVSDQMNGSSSLPALNTALDLGGLAPNVEIEIIDLTDVASNPLIALLPQNDEIALATYLPTVSDPVAIDTNIQVTVALDLPEGVQDLSKVRFTDASKLTVSLSIPNCPLTDGELNPNITVDFASLLQIAGGGSIDLSALKLTKANSYQASQQYSVQELKIAAGDFNANLHKLSLDKKVTVTGNASVTNPKTTPAQVVATGKLKVKVAVTLSNLEVDEVEAKVAYDLAGNEVTVELDDLTGAFGDNLEVTLDLYNPSLKFDLSTNLGIPANVQATLLPWKDNAPKTAEQVQVNFTMPASPSATQTVTAKYFLASHDEGRPAAYTYLAADIASLIKMMPDSVQISFAVTTDPTQTAVLEPAATYNFNVAYEVNVPIQVGEDFRVALRDTLEIGSVGKYIALAEEAAIIGSAENTLPLNLKLTVNFADDNDNLIALSAPVQQTLASGKADGSATVTPLELKVKFADKKAAENVTKVILAFEATSGGVTRAVKETDYVQAKLAAGLWGGVTFDIKDLPTGDENTDNH